VKNKAVIPIFLLLILLSCNSGYREMVHAVSGQSYCLDTARTNHANNMNIGSGRLRFLPDKTFIIKLDRFPLEKLVGKWDVCCEGSDYGNYIFYVNGLPDWKQAEPNLFVLLENQPRRLYFSFCDFQQTKKK